LRESCRQWNDAILELGKRRVALDVVLIDATEPRSLTHLLDAGTESLERHRLEMDLASQVMSQTTDNFVDLCANDYVGSRMYRFEKNTGICGGDVVSNTGKQGRAANKKARLPQIEISDPLALWHIAGTVSMIVPTVGQVDSRFLLCTQDAPHLDGINRAFGQLTEESLDRCRLWQRELLTQTGVPVTHHLVVVSCNVEGSSSSIAEANEITAA